MYSTSSRISNEYRPPNIMSQVICLSTLGLSPFERSVNVNKIFQHVDYQQNPSVVGQTQTYISSFAVDTIIPNPNPVPVYASGGFFVGTGSDDEFFGKRSTEDLFENGSSDIEFFGNGSDYEFFN